MILAIYIILIVFILIDYIKNKELLTPIKTFNAIWLITIFLYEFKLSYVQQDLSERTLWIFIICILAYDLTASFVDFIKFKKNNNKNVIKKKKKTIDEKIKIANIVFVVIFVIEIIYSRGFPVLWKITGDSRNYLNFGITSLHGAMNGLAICLGGYTLFKKKNKSKYIYIIFGILTLSRQVLLSLIVEAIIFNIQQINFRENKKINYKKYIALAIVVFLAFNILGNFRSGSDVMGIVFRPREGYENLSTATMWSYSYLTFSISNFNKLVGMTDGMVNYGASMLKSFLPTVILKVTDIQENYKENYLVQSNFNVSTYLPEIYLDFGIFGIAIFNMIIAALGVYIYKKSKMKKNNFYFMFYAILVHNVVFLFFVNMYIYIPIVVQYIYIYYFFDKNEEIKGDGQNISNCNNSGL